jgi:hypothetical protein
LPDYPFRKQEVSMRRLTTALLMMLALGLPAQAAAQDEDFQVFKRAERQVLGYPHFTIFDSVHARVDDGVVTLTGKVTMPYKRDDIGWRAPRA